MSQKVHPKGFRLRSTGHLSPFQHPIDTKESSILTSYSKASFETSDRVEHQGKLPKAVSETRSVPKVQSTFESINKTWDSIWFSEPKKGKHFYTRLLHEDQLIEDYTKGFFRSFGFYQQKCVIERKCNKELSITSYVLRTPKIQPSKIDLIGTRTRQEKVLQEGLQQGWIPFLIQSVISKILYDKSQSFRLGKNEGFLRKRSFPTTTGIKGSSGTFDLEQSSIPSIAAILTSQENSTTQVLTNQKRFHDFWNSWIFSTKKGIQKYKVLSEREAFQTTKGSSELPLKTSSKTFNPWWTHRSWSSLIYYPSINGNWDQKVSEISYGGCNSAKYCHSTLPFMEVAPVLPMKVNFSIQPSKSLISSSQLIVDYMADKIEQSTPVGLIFNELLRFFETEALCLGPAFMVPHLVNLSESKKKEISTHESNASRSEAKVPSVDGSLNDSSESLKSSLNTMVSQRPKVLGFRIVCSGRLQISSFSKPAEKAESIEITRGVLPLNSLKANIDFAQTYATNAYGTCGIKVWVNRG